MKHDFSRSVPFQRVVDWIPKAYNIGCSLNKTYIYYILIFTFEKWQLSRYSDDFSENLSITANSVNEVRRSERRHKKGGENITKSSIILAYIKKARLRTTWPCPSLIPYPTNPPSFLRAHRHDSNLASH